MPLTEAPAMSAYSAGVRLFPIIGICPLVIPLPGLNIEQPIDPYKKVGCIKNDEKGGCADSAEHANADRVLGTRSGA